MEHSYLRTPIKKQNTLHHNEDKSYKYKLDSDNTRTTNRENADFIIRPH